ncbi:MAG: ATP-binding protein [Acidobacteriota bacterium]|nr:ATP-binding protein [Acidobacteriota bacterium]
MEQEEKRPAAKPGASGGVVREAFGDTGPEPKAGRWSWSRILEALRRPPSELWSPSGQESEGASSPDASSEPPKLKGWFSRVRFAVPFGRYESADEQEPPAHEVMVGREGQRAFFLDLLFNSGRRGAFLVTGRRGSGKTSFVRHCLAEYEDEVYQRFLRSNVGRSLFWDRILLALIALAVVFVALLLTDLLDVIGVAAQSSGAAAEDSALKPVPGKIFLRLLGIPIIILCAYPWLYGRELFEVAFRALLESPGRRDRRAAILALVASVLLGFAVFFLGPFGAPALGISRLLVVFSIAMLWVYATSYERSTSRQRPGADASRSLAYLALRGILQLLKVSLLLVPAIFYLWGGFGLVIRLADKLATLLLGSLPPAASSWQGPRMEFVGDLGLALCLAALATVLRAVYLYFSPAYPKEGSQLPDGAKGYLLVGAAQGLVGALLVYHAQPRALGLVGVALGAVLILVGSCLLYFRQRSSARPLVFRPRPLVVVTGKGLLCTVIAIQLLNPLLCDDNWIQREVKHLFGSQAHHVSAVAWALYPPPELGAQLDEAPRSPFPQAFLDSRRQASNLATDADRSLRSPFPQAFLASQQQFLENFRRSVDPLPISSPPSAQSSSTSPPSGVGGDLPSAAPSSAAVADPSAGDLPSQEGQRSRGAEETLGPETVHDGLFASTAEEVRWVLVVFSFLVLLHSCEYEWIVRPFHRHRVDRSFDPKVPAPHEDVLAGVEDHRSAYTYRMLARTTFFWTLHKTWSPLLVSSVNLGFERLDHRRVVQAMLIDLRERYNRKFVAWNSVIGNVIRVIKVLVLILVVAMAGRHWFKVPDFESLPPARQAALCTGAATGYADACEIFRGHQGTGGAAAALCNLDPDSGLFHLAYTNLVVGLNGMREAPYSTDNLLLGLLPYRENEYPPIGPETAVADCQTSDLLPLLRPGFELRLYHLVLLGLFYLLFRWVTTRLPLPPYRHTLARIDSVLDGLSSRRNLTSKQSRWGPIHWVRGFLSNERVEQLEQEPVDPRITEIAFLTILRDINSSVLRLPGAQGQVVSLPTPEVIFFFDELDKLGTRVDPSAHAMPATPQKSEEIDAERRRSLELHKLLADMKNMLSASDARFIFVGGRNLHDEWLADQTARQPLLTNIFNAEVYLPSLLTDSGRGEESFLHMRVERYLEAQKHRADALYEQTAKTLWRPELVINSLDRRSETFAQPKQLTQHPKASTGDSDALVSPGVDLKRHLDLKMLETTSGSTIKIWGSNELLTDLIFFLSWRSLGNAKRLKELLATFVRPASRFVTDDAVRWQSFQCRHVLALRDIDRFRMQLIASVYRHLSLHFEQSLVNRDDKLAASTFYLADFLFKFHDRAFSWGNLERVDELVHIHRAPDLRQLLESMVEKWSRWVLHPIRNAMYGFRFRSDFAREISYLSRQSPDEMAAFNFTLDESQELKMLYALRIRRLSPDAHGELAELYAALGELHEFDQEYEDARLFYRRALVCLDQQHENIVGEGGLLSTTTHHMDLLSRSQTGLEGARQYMIWGISRLRLMLQIAMTYERARDFERAGLKYRDARSLSNALLVAMLDNEGRRAFRRHAGYGEAFPSQSDRLHTLKNLNIIFQPVFAEGWVAEKYEGGVDTGVALLETQLRLFREVLPFVRSSKALVAGDAYDIHESNFALIISELHNKLGDTYFFRGKQPMTVAVLDRMIEALGRTTGQPEKSRVGNEGYLMRSYYHYSLGLHELRRYITYRRLSSEKKFNIMQARHQEDSTYELWETIDRMGWPDFVFRAVGESLNDLAESALARVSLYGLLWTRMPPETTADESGGEPTQLFATLVDWFEGRTEDGDPEQRRIQIRVGSQLIAAGTLSGWLGEWNANPAPKNLPLDFKEVDEHHDPQRLLVSLELTRQSAHYLEKGGYREEAAGELLEICAIVTRMIWWYVMVKFLIDPGLKMLKPEGLREKAIWRYEAFFRENDQRETVYWSHLFQVALEAFEDATRLLRLDRRAFRFLRRKAARGEKTDQAYLVGSIIPPRALSLACSLGAACSLAGKNLLGPSWRGQRKQLCELIGEWTGQKDGDDLEYFLKTLKMALVRHPYPMVSRLQALKALIDATTLKTSAEAATPLEKIHLEGTQLEDMLRYVEELQFLEAQYASPLHFTPLEMGVSLALVDLRFRASQAAHGSLLGLSQTRRRRLEEIRDEAKRYLQQSSETYTMRRAYYENIQRLYYLYDDFNDRQIHFNLAMQMAGSEICLILSELVDIDLPSVTWWTSICRRWAPLRSRRSLQGKQQPRRKRRPPKGKVNSEAEMATDEEAGSGKTTDLGESTGPEEEKTPE